MRTAVTWLAVGTAACAAIAVAMHVRRRSRLSDLEHRVGNPKRTALSKRRERNARQLATNKMYYAFVSHMKVEAAMEARFLQIELESLNDDEVSSSTSEIMRTCSDRVFSQLTSKCLLLPTFQLVFLDSDDLRDLTKLVQHVKDSRCIILLQTRKVMTRPYCILEVLTALENSVPIVTVTVTGKHSHDAYNFEEMSQMLTFLETELEHWNPGAADVLCDHGYDDLVDVAYRLSCAIPKTISVSLNTGASRNVLRATMEDLVSAVEDAKANPLQLPDKAAWLAAREKMTRPQRQIAPPTQPAAAPRSGQEAEAKTARVVCTAGSQLMAQAARNPALLPLAFAVQALSSGGQAALTHRDECQLISATAAPLERLLLRAAPTALPAALQAVNAAVEGLAILQARCSRNAVSSDRSASPPIDFEPAKAALISSVAKLGPGVSDSAEGRAAAADLAMALQGQPQQPVASGGGGHEVDLLEVTMPHLGAASHQRDVLEMQNKVLMEQVAQMQKLMASRQMSMQSYLEKFPQPPDEAERRLVLLKKDLMNAPRANFRKVDDVLRNLVISGALGPGCRGALFNVIGENQARSLSIVLQGDEGELITFDDLPEAISEQRVSRKASTCQYVVARGEYQSFGGGPNGGASNQCFMMDVMKESADSIANNAELQALQEADPAYKDFFNAIAMMVRARPRSILCSPPQLSSPA